MTLIKSKFPAWPELSDFFEDEWFKGRINGDWSPAVNVVDNKDNYEVEMAAPGFNKSDFNVSVQNGLLTIEAKTEKEEEEKKKNYTRKEFTSKSFSKSFTLPEDVTEDDIEAKYEDGVLKMTLKKTEKQLPPKKTVAID